LLLELKKESNISLIVNKRLFKIKTDSALNKKPKQTVSRILYLLV
jgi:hypothetical protein